MSLGALRIALSVAAADWTRAKGSWVSRRRAGGYAQNARLGSVLGMGTLCSAPVMALNFAIRDRAR